MSLEEIRNMDDYDFQTHLRIFMSYERADMEFKLSLQGVDVDHPNTQHKKLI